MHRSFSVRVALAGLVAAIGAVVVFTLAVYLPSPGRALVDDAATFSAPPSATAAQEEPDEEESEEQRFPAGTAIPLPIDRETRDQLSAAARAVVDPSGPAKGAMNVATSGTIYYGVVYGGTPETDMRYVVASIDQLYFWRQKGDGPWEFQGGHDARVCEPAPPAVPRALTGAWGHDPGRIPGC
ncbi:hypothetical protein [Planotetraspora kaengkrachanensis]|nr:hypothetical protein [Planotetraspora kaengkrachanensis]